MAAEVYEDALELTVPILEAVLPDSEQYLASAYPYPSLRATGRMERRKFRTVVLENPYLRVVIVPDLGGRILRIFDKRTNTDIFPDEPLTPIEGGSRGVEVAHGIQLRYTPQDRPNSLGTVNYQLVHAGDEEDEPGVWIGEVSGPLSFNALISIPPDAAELKLELRMFNRAIGDTRYNGGLSIALTNSSAQHTDQRYKNGFVVHSDNRGVLAKCQREAVAAIWHDNDRLAIHRWTEGVEFTMSPRQLDIWKFTLLPHSTLKKPILVSEVGALSIEENAILFNASRVLEGHSIQITTCDDQTFDAPLNASPGKVLRFPFEHVAAIKSIHLLRPSAFPLIGFSDFDKPITIAKSEKRNMDNAAEIESRYRRGLRKELNPHAGLMQRLPTFRFEGFLIGAHGSAIAKTDRTKIDECIEQALLYNGEDHLAWWAKAMFKRMETGTNDESPELLNAHYLAPLEPLLRVEGFLSQPVSQGRNANPILKSLDDSPEQFVDCACQLLSWWQFAEGSRFIDEALRHNDLPMLRYLHAYALIVGTKMEVEAAAHVQAAGKLSFGPPFPWRSIELDALQALHERFPYDERLKRYLSLCKRFDSFGQ